MKRDNILIRSRNGEPVLVDFGIGNAAEATTLPGFGLLPPGTPEYVSPEAWRFLGENVGEPVTYKSRVSDELWALGVTFYWLLTNRLPFGTRRNPLMVKAILGLTPKAPHECNPRIPKALSDVCMRMLEKDLAARFPDMAALCAALESVLAVAQGDASWDVALGDPDAPEEPTTDETPAQAKWNEEELAVRRCFAPPRRGEKNLSAEENRPPGVAPPVMPAALPSPAPVAEALAARMAALFPDRAWEGVPLPEGEVADPSLSAVQVSADPRPGVVASQMMGGSGPTREAAPRRGTLRLAASRAFPTLMGSLPVRAVILEGLRRVALVLTLMAVAAAASAGAMLAAAPFSLTGGTAQRQTAPEPPTSPTDNSTLRAYLASELAVSRDSPQAGGSAALFLPPTPAPEFTTAMLRKEDLSVNTPEKPQARRARFREKCVTAACCAVLGGCAGAPPVRTVPKPADCPSKAVETMERKLDIDVWDSSTAALPVIGGPQYTPVREGVTSIALTDRFGKLPVGTVLSGNLLFGEDRVYGRFTQARTPDGDTYPVCIQFVRDGKPGLPMESSSAKEVKVGSHFSVIAVDRFR